MKGVRPTMAAVERICTRWRTMAVVAVCFLVSASLQAWTSPAAVVDAYRAVLAEDDDVRVLRVAVSPDGSFWLLAVDYNFVFEGADNTGNVRCTGTTIFARHLDPTGRPLHDDVRLSGRTGTAGLQHVEPLGFSSRGELFVSLTIGSGSPDYRLARLGPKGQLSISLDAVQTPLTPFCVVSSSSLVRTFWYAGTDMWTYLFDGAGQEIRLISTSRQCIGDLPVHLTWYGDVVMMPVREGGFLVAVNRLRGDSAISLYRVEAATLALLDSGRLKTPQHAYREVHVDSYADLHEAGASYGSYLVNDSEEWFWLYTTKWTVSESRPRPDDTRLLVYRISSELGPVAGGIIEPVETRARFDPAGGGKLVVDVRASQADFLVSRGAWHQIVRHTLQFSGFGSDGQVYSMSESFGSSYTVSRKADNAGRNQ